MSDKRCAENKDLLKERSSTTHGNFIPRFTHILSAFKEAGNDNPEATAIRYFDGSLSYAEVDRLSDSLAAWFSNRGVGVDDRVALVLQNAPVFVLALLAVWKIGAIAVPINPMNKPRELTLLLSDSVPGAIVCHPDNVNLLAPVLAETGLESVPMVVADPCDFQERNDPRVLTPTATILADNAIDLGTVIKDGADCPAQPSSSFAQGPALIVYTSGTTGKPKGAVISHANIAYNAEVYRQWISLKQGVSILGLSPLFHVTGLVGHIAAAIAAAGTLVLSYRFDPHVMLDAIAEHRPNFTIGAITAFISLMNIPGIPSDTFSSFEAIYSGGAAIPPAIVAEFAARFGKQILPSYGLTETTSPSHLAPRNAAIPIDPATHALSIGKPVYGAEVNLLSETGGLVAPGEMGEIAIKGPMVVSGYWNQPDATAEAIRDGWLLTGDMATNDEQGWYYIVDRKKDMINAAGFKVWPREVEDVLHSHPAVREAAVLGVPDSYRGETVKAVVSFKAGASATPTELETFCRARMAAYKVPRQFAFIDELPKTASGKVLRRALR